MTVCLKWLDICSSYMSIVDRMSLCLSILQRMLILHLSCGEVHLGQCTVYVYLLTPKLLAN